MKNTVKIIDVTQNPKYEGILYRCIFHKRKNNYGKRTLQRINAFYNQRYKYLKTAIPKGFHKKILIFKEDIVGTIEYAPPKASGLPIIGDEIIVMNCIWVHRKAGGHNFGKLILADMMKDEKKASGFATIALEKHWMRWMKKEHIEKIGFKSVKSIRVRHKIKHKEKCFKIHLMWLPVKKDAEPPLWNESKLLEGIYYCMSHPLYHGRYGAEKMKLKEIFERCH